MELIKSTSKRVLSLSLSHTYTCTRKQASKRAHTRTCPRQVVPGNCKDWRYEIQKKSIKSLKILLAGRPPLGPQEPATGMVCLPQPRGIFPGPPEEAVFCPSTSVSCLNPQIHTLRIWSVVFFSIVFILLSLHVSFCFSAGKYCLTCSHLSNCQNAGKYVSTVIAF